jgi:hypothetical protein
MPLPAPIPLPASFPLPSSATRPTPMPPPLARVTPELLVLDLDGTIVDDADLVDPLTAEAVSIVADSGVRVVLATGRSPWNGVADVTRLLGLAGPQISMQGAIVADPLDGEVVLARELPAIAYLGALALAAELGLDPIVSIADGHRAEHVPDWLAASFPTAGEGQRFRYVDDLARLVDEPPFRIYLPTGPARHDAVRRTFQERLGDRASIVWTDNVGVEILAPDVDKGTAVAWLADSLGIDMHRVAAVGDARNDVGMLLRAGQSAAMATAPAELRTAADIVVPSVTEHGAIRAMAWFFPELAPDLDALELDGGSVIAETAAIQEIVFGLLG